jgi:phospholipase C
MFTFSVLVRVMAALAMAGTFSILTACGGGSSSGTSAGNTGSSTPSLQITTQSLPSGTQLSSYYASLSATGGVTPYSWLITSGTLPAGLSLAASTGGISGTPTSTGTSTFTVQVTDSESPARAVMAQMSITIAAPPPLEVTTQSLPGGARLSPYNASLAATGGVAPYSWSTTTGSLPTGLTLAASTGVVSGTPTSTGTSGFTVQVTDSESPAQAVTATLSITIAASTASPITHVIVIVQENRSTDNLFQDPVLISRGADIQNYGIDSDGNTIPLAQLPLAVDFDPNHSNYAWKLMCDLQPNGQCKMDGANLIPISCNQGATDCPGTDLNFGYVNPSDVQPYFQFAETYTFADRMFQTNEGPSMPAHQFLLSGTSAPTANSNLFAAENPDTTLLPDAGCDAPPTATVVLVGPSGKNMNTPIYPCFEHETLTDLLETAGLNWKYYASPSADGLHGQPAIWNAPEAIQHICGPNLPPPNATECVGADWNNHVVLNQTQVLKDIPAGNLAEVSWVIPTGQDSDHPGTANTGPSWVASIVNAVGASPYWQNTAIFITWDDWGGWYDHVPPSQVLVNCSVFGCGYVYGFRVPLIVVSAYAKAGYISHQQHDFGSILKYIETNFDLPSLGYADAAADDFSDCFNYGQTPLQFQTIKAPLKADFFLHDTRPPTDPDDD